MYPLFSYGDANATKGRLERKPVSEALRVKMGTVAVIYENEPRAALNCVTKNKVEGAGKGALGGATLGTAVPLEGGPLSLIFLSVFATVGAGAGAIAGSVVATDAENNGQY